MKPSLAEASRNVGISCLGGEAVRPSLLSHQKTWGGCGMGVRMKGPGEGSLELQGAKGPP